MDGAEPDKLLELLHAKMKLVGQYTYHKRCLDQLLRMLLRDTIELRFYTQVVKMKIYEGSIADIVQINDQPTLISKNGKVRIRIPEEYIVTSGLIGYEEVIDSICGASSNIF